MVNPKLRGDARSASDVGCAALRAGRRDEAVRWLDRAHRMAPDDVSTKFLLASALVGVDDQAGVALLLALAADYPEFRDAQVALVAAEHRAGEPMAAAQRLGALLARTAPPPGEAFVRLADAVARAAGAPGWIAANSAGQVLCSAAGGTLALRLDDVKLPARRGAIRQLPPRWRDARFLSAVSAEGGLLGSPIDLAALRRVEGFAEITPDGDLDGFAWLPGDPDAMPELTVRSGEDAGAAVKLRADDLSRTISVGFGAALPRGFRVPADALPTSGALRVVGGDGRDLAGSPLLAAAERAAARAAASRLGLRNAAGPGAADPWRPLPVEIAMPAAPDRAMPKRPGVDIVLPVYRGAADFVACVASLRRGLPRGARIVVVDDASPDPALVRALDEAVARREIVLLRHAANRGFPAAVNTGLRHAATGRLRDVVLLNPDTLLPPGAIGRLADAAYSAADIGSVTPLSNDGTIVSFPRPGDATVPDLAGTDRLDRLAQTANAGVVVDLPTSVGFCMFIRHDCLEQTGLFREDAFAQGYGEENDWCLRARHLGWRHVAAAGVFVAHVGGRSFGPVKSHLLARNLRVLNRLHPGYDAFVADHLARDSLAPARRRIDEQRWREGRSEAGAVVLISHDLDGGVGRHVRERCLALRAEGLRPVVLQPLPAGLGCVVSDGMEEAFPDLRFGLPSQMAELVDLLRPDRPAWVEAHHLLGHAPEIADLAGRLGVPCDVVVHDYALWCPRVTLCGRTQSYCGEPAQIEECEACVADLGGRTGEAIGVAALRARSAALLRSARRVVVPCRDVATRIARQFPAVRPIVSEWEEGPFEAEPFAGTVAGAAVHRKSGGGPAEIRIVVPGAIGPEKGYDVLLACARDAARRKLSLSFSVVGHTIDDGRLLDTGAVFVTGRYEEAEAVHLIRRQNAHLAFIPSVWPETWCYSLSNAWRAGLRAVSFALGAQAERIARAGTGAVLPLGMPPARVNDALIELGRIEGGRIEAGGTHGRRDMQAAGRPAALPPAARPPLVALSALARNA